MSNITFITFYWNHFMLIIMESCFISLTENRIRRLVSPVLGERIQHDARVRDDFECERGTRTRTCGVRDRDDGGAEAVAA